MAYVSLYRKYRPHKFDDVVGQDIIVKILKNSIKNNKINHAYIFSGPRGTGKTSIAKIFAKAVNCLNKTGDVCDECDACKINIDEEIDIVEIDAASNNGVDEIREIRNTIKLLPTILKYKVYIIDEVHMLSPNAFNALLKTLEEPPAHAIFILATTEIHKIPATVLSRCQKFDFKKISLENIIGRLNYICENEKINFSDEIIKLIAELSDGGLRDAINLLDQLVSLNKKIITRTDVYNLIGSIDDSEIYELFDSVIKADIKETIKIINNYYDNGRNFINVITKMENLIKDILIFNNTDNYFDESYEKLLFNYSKLDVDILIKFSENLFTLNNELKKSNNQKIITEIYFINLNNTNNDNTTTPQISQNNKEKIVEENEEDIDENIKNIIINNALYGANKQLKIEFINNIDKLNDYITDKNYNNIANLLIKGSPEVVSDECIIYTFDNNFDVVLFNKNGIEIIKLFKKIYGKKYNVIAVNKEEWANIKETYIKNTKSGLKYTYMDLNLKKTKGKKKNTELQNSVENIFGDEYITEE